MFICNGCWGKGWFSDQWDSRLLENGRVDISVCAPAYCFLPFLHQCDKPKLLSLAQDAGLDITHALMRTATPWRACESLCHGIGNVSIDLTEHRTPLPFLNRRGAWLDRYHKASSVPQPPKQAHHATHSSCSRAPMRG